jgi:D-mannonate dehydratase
MRHSNKLGNLIKDINRLMKVKRELNEIMELSSRLCNADALCDGSCNAVPEELSEYYVVKNYIIYFLFVKFKLCQRDFHKKSGCP